MNEELVTLCAETKSESLALLKLYYGVSLAAHSANEHSVKNITSRAGMSYKKKCPQCGEKFKNLKTHILFKHDKEGKVGWHITGKNPEGSASMIQKHKNHPELIDA